MKAFEDFQNNRLVNTIGYLYITDAYEAGEEGGWRAALEWVKGEAISLDERGDISRKIIDRELNG